MPYKKPHERVVLMSYMCFVQMLLNDGLNRNLPLAAHNFRVADHLLVSDAGELW